MSEFIHDLIKCFKGLLLLPVYILELICGAIYVAIILIGSIVDEV